MINENKFLSSKYKELLENKITELPTENESEEVACLKDQIEVLTRVRFENFSRLYLLINYISRKKIVVMIYGKIR